MGWKFWRKPKPDTTLQNWPQWETEAAARGYRHWAHDRPPDDAWVEAIRREWPAVQTFNVMDVHPMMNVAGLWWRETSLAARGLALD